MENSAEPKSPNARASIDPTSLESLQISFGNLCMKNGKIEINGSVTPQGNRPPSSLPLNVSLTGVLPGSGLRNGDSILASSKTESLFPSLNHRNLNGAGYQPHYLSENLKDSLFRCFPNQNPSLPAHSEAIATAGNPLRNGFNISNESSCGLQNLRRNGIITLALTEKGSKDVQNLLLLKDPRVTKLIFEGVMEYIFQLMTNQYGRYLFQKLIELEDENQLKIIIEKLTGSYGTVFYASIDRYGSYSMKKLIKVLEKSPLITGVVKALSNKFWDLMINPIGQYVILDCLDVVDSQKNDLLYIQAIDKCLQLATHERGCISLNSFIYRIKGPRRDQLLNLICDHVVYLAQDPSGNFVVQCVLGLQNPAIIDKICCKLRGYYVKLSMQKGGSHLVEKCLKSSGMDHVVDEFLQSNQLFQVAKDRYGNYVLQTALRETENRGSPVHTNLIVKLRSFINFLQHGFGRNILTLMTANGNKV